MKRLLIAVSLMGALAGAPGTGVAEAERITNADAKAIHEVVQSQLEALSHDDAESAFELATSDKRLLLGNAANFLQLIKQEYDPIYHYQLAIFSRARMIDGAVIQLVRLTDEYSKVWVAIFWLKRDPDKSWKIDGCELLATTSTST